MMADNYIVVDSVAFQNLFEGGGTAAWEQLLSGGKKIVLSSVIEEEIRNANNNFSQAFDAWKRSKNITVVQFEVDGIRFPEDHPRAGELRPAADGGDKTLRALLDPDNVQAQEAMRRAGIDANGTFRLLTELR
jgi:hypothetical protein